MCCQCAPKCSGLTALVGCCCVMVMTVVTVPLKRDGVRTEASGKVLQQRWCLHFDFTNLRRTQFSGSETWPSYSLQCLWENKEADEDLCERQLWKQKTWEYSEKQLYLTCLRMAGCAARVEPRVKLSHNRDNCQGGEEDAGNAKIKHRGERDNLRRSVTDKETKRRRKGEREGNKSIRNVQLKSSAGIRDGSFSCETISEGRAAPGWIKAHFSIAFSLWHSFIY